MNIFLLFYIFPSIFCWGHGGHYIIAALARRLLNDESKMYFDKLFPEDTLLDYWASWPDQAVHTTNYSYTKSFHFINVNTDLQECQFSWKRDCKSKDGTENSCLTSAIVDYARLFTVEWTRWFTEYYPLDSPSQEAMDFYGKLKTTISFLIHFIGDIHQPLHVGFASDRGGVLKKVVLPDEYLEIRAPKQLNCNLHSVWDYHSLDWFTYIHNTTHDGLVDILYHRIKQNPKKYEIECDFCYPYSTSKNNLKDIPEPTDDNINICPNIACPSIWAQQTLFSACNNAYALSNEPFIDGKYHLTMNYILKSADTQLDLLAKTGFRLKNTITQLLPHTTKTHSIKYTVVIVSITVLVITFIIIIIWYWKSISNSYSSLSDSEKTELPKNTNDEYIPLTGTAKEYDPPAKDDI